MNYPMGINCDPLISDLLSNGYASDFMSNLRKSSRFDLINKFNDNSLYLGNTFTIYNPEFENEIPYLYLTKL